MGSVILSAVRTPIGAFQGALGRHPAPELGAAALQEAVARSRIAPEQLDEVLMGQVLSAGAGQAPARQAALAAGIPPSVGATTVNKVCGSGLKAVMLADQAIRAGEGRVYAVGGMESMSNAPYLLTRARGGYRMGHGELIDSMILDGLWDPHQDWAMGNAAELVARHRSVSRREQDVYAVESNRRALQARREGAFDAEIIAVAGRDGTPVEHDECPRESSLEALLALPPIFDKGGTVTAGNSSKISDGAAALVLAGDQEAERLGAAPLARLVASASHAQEPEWLMTAPAGAVRKLLARAGIEIEQVDLFEINEPFAAASCALLQELSIDPERMNPHGGAVALGHPIGATGARLLVTLVHALRRRGGRYGVAALCLGGGEAVAVLVEALPS